MWWTRPGRESVGLRYRFRKGGGIGIGPVGPAGCGGGGGAGFCQEAFMCPVHLHRAVQGLVQIALEVANMRWVMEVAEVEEVVREDARFPKLERGDG